MRISISFNLTVDNEQLVAVGTLLRSSSQAVSRIGNVARVRLQQFEVVKRKAKGIFNVLFTVLAPPAVDLQNDVPENYFTSNKKVKAALRKAVDNAEFRVNFEGADEN